LFTILYQYLVRNKELSLPGLGRIHVVTAPARLDIANKLLLPPQQQFHFSVGTDTASKKLYSWLADHYRCSEWDAIRKLNDLVFAMRQAMQAGNRVTWKGVGTFQQPLGGQPEFTAEEKHFVFEQQVAAEKIIRYKQEHQMLVGDRETTSTLMTEFLTRPGAERTGSLLPRWWAIAIVLAFLAIMFIGWHFSEYGLRIESAGSIRKVESKEATPTYRPLR
jgi:hypothetical protein